MANSRFSLPGNGGAPRRPRPRSIDATFSVDFTHRLRFTRDALDPRNLVLRHLIEAGGDDPARMVVFVDEGVAAAWPGLAGEIAAYAAGHRDVLSLAADPVVVPGGERAKNDMAVYETVIGAIAEAGICRHSYVLVIGGGAVLDAVGFAAATAHRGVRVLRMPSTTLAQSDAGIGVKNGVNALDRKNFIGTFAVPWAVVNDERYLETLSDRDWRCGLSEAVKVAVLKDAAFFRRIAALAPRLAGRDEAAAIPIVQHTAELHLNHIAGGGDPFETRNARPLDFGHWSAHRLEQLSGFRLAHGEAVAIGIALDTVYSGRLGLLAPEDVRAILACLSTIGFRLYDALLADHEALFEGLEDFREHLGGRLTITLLAGIGRPVDVHEIDTGGGEGAAGGGGMVAAIEHLAASASRVDAGA